MLNDEGSLLIFTALNVLSKLEVNVNDWVALDNVVALGAAGDVICTNAFVVSAVEKIASISWNDVALPSVAFIVQFNWHWAPSDKTPQD